MMSAAWAFLPSGQPLSSKLFIAGAQLAITYPLLSAMAPWLAKQSAIAALAITTYLCMSVLLAYLFHLRDQSPPFHTQAEFFRHGLATKSIVKCDRVGLVAVQRTWRF